MDSKDYNVSGSLHASLAQAYDPQTMFFTLGLHRVIKKILCTKAIKLTPQNSKLLDPATGTADVILGIAPNVLILKIVGLDISAAMLDIAQEKN